MSRTIIAAHVYFRPCPKCGASIGYKRKDTRNEAQRHGRSCLSCRPAARFRQTHCDIHQCQRAHYALGRCKFHYQRVRNSGTPGSVEPNYSHFGRERRKTTKASTRPTIRDLHWAAGFIEGEGHVSSRADGSTGMGAAQVEREPLEQLQRFFGGSIYHRENGHKGIHNWFVSGARARGVMLTLYVLMGRRRQGQISRALRG